MVAIKKIQEAKVSQSVVGRTNATKQSGLLGMLHNPYVFMTCCFASLGCMMYGYDQVWYIESVQDTWLTVMYRE